MIWKQVLTCYHSLIKIEGVDDSKAARWAVTQSTEWGGTGVAKRFLCTASTWARRSPSSTGQSERSRAPRSGWSGARLPALTVRGRMEAVEYADCNIIYGQFMTDMLQATPVSSVLSSDTTSRRRPSVPPSASCCTPPTSKGHNSFDVWSWVEPMELRVEDIFGTSGWKGMRWWRWWRLRDGWERIPTNKNAFSFLPQGYSDLLSGSSKRVFYFPPRRAWYVLSSSITFSQSVSDGLRAKIHTTSKTRNILHHITSEKKSSFNISLYTRVFARVQPRFFAAIILDTTRPHAMSYQYDVLTETNTPIFPHQSPANDLYKAITHAISDSATPQARPWYGHFIPT